MFNPMIAIVIGLNQTIIQLLKVSKQYYQSQTSLVVYYSSIKVHFKYIKCKIYKDKQVSVYLVRKNCTNYLILSIEFLFVFFCHLHWLKNKMQHTATPFLCFLYDQASVLVCLAFFSKTIFNIFIIQNYNLKLRSLNIKYFNILFFVNIRSF